MEKLFGKGNGCGLALGPCALLASDQEVQVQQRQAADPAAELRRFDEAVQQAEQQLQVLVEQVKDQVGAKDAAIFEMHIAFLYDPGYTGAIRQCIEQKGEAAEWAVQEQSAALAQIFSGVEGDIIPERADDIRDVGARLIRILQNHTDEQFPLAQGRSIIVAQQLLPSQTIRLNFDRVAAVVTQEGGITSHAAILTKAKGIPAVVGAQGVFQAARQGVPIIVDADKGLVLLDPDAAMQEEYRQRIWQQEDEAQHLKAYINRSAVTKGGQRVLIEANIGSPADAQTALQAGAEGVGLFRSEFLYLDRADEPDEEEQFQAYRQAVEAMQGRQVIIRTMDIGGDKPLKYLNLPQEDNPFLGYRAIRVCLDREELFLTQLRAILRASVFGKAAIMFPMISSLEELRRAKALVQQAGEQLEHAGLAYDKTLPIGIMIEVPAAAVLSDRFAQEADFFSIGTNDLVQYTVAADRMNPKVSGLYTPCHPGVVRLIQQVVENSHRYGKTTAICGEAAGDMLLLPIWAALGVDALSMSPVMISRAKQQVCSLEPRALEQLKQEILQQDTASAILACCKRFQKG